jgi:hypothetical protein
MHFDDNNKGVLLYNNLKDMFDWFDLQPTERQIKHIFTDFGSCNDEYSIEAPINHQLTLTDFLSIFTNYDIESIHNVSLFSRRPQPNEGLVLSISKRVLKHELEYQAKIDSLRCNLKLQMDFLTILRIFNYSPKRQFIRRDKLKQFTGIIIKVFCVKSMKMCILNQELCCLMQVFTK